MADEFSNEPLPVEGLPRLDDADFVPVDPRHLIPWFVSLGIAGVAAIVIAAIVSSQADPVFVPLLIGAMVVLGVVALAVISVIEMRRLAYQLREHDISYRSGAIGRSVATIPFGRVQHVSVTRGPVERWLGLATLGINSAGPDLSIPGLTEDDAERLKLFIVERSDASTDESEPDDHGRTTPPPAATNVATELPPPPPPAPPAPAP